MTTNVKSQVAILQEAVTRMDFARRHGLSYDGKRDIYQVAGYPRNLAFKDFWEMYDRDGVAGQIVDMPAETTWRRPPEVKDVGATTEGGTEFERTWKDLARRLDLWQRFERVDRLSRIGRYAVLLLGARTTQDRELEQPLTSLRGPDDLLYLSAYHEGLAEIKEWADDPTDPRFGQPEVYEIDLSSGVETFRPGAGASNKVMVHHTRVLHIAEGLLNDEVYGRPVLKRIYNDLLDLQKVSASTAEAFWQIVGGILAAKIDPEAVISDEDVKKLDEDLLALYHDLRRTWWGQGIELDRLSGETPRPEEAVNLYMTRISAGAGIPKRMLFGSETGERASTEDQKTYLGSIAERQRQHAEPAILRAFVDRCLELRALPRPGADGYEIVWPALFEEPEKDIAEANLSRARTAAALTPIGGDPIDLVEIDENRSVWLRPTGERGELTPEELEPEEPEPEEEPVVEPEEPEGEEEEGDEP